MNYTINTDTGNIQEDIWTMIDNFSDNELNKFIESIKLKKDNSNIVGVSLFFRYPDCEKLLESIQRSSKVPIEIRKKIRERTHRLNTEDLFNGISNQETIKNTLVKRIVEKIKSKINIKEKFIEVLSNDKYDINFYTNCFKIIGSDEYFNKFLNYQDNIDLFDSKYTQEEYVFELSKILGYQANDINKSNPVYKYQFITPEMIERYLKLRKIINVDIKMLGDNIFSQGEKTSYTKEQQEKIDNDWVVNPEMMEYIMKDMDPNYNVLEQISHIYIKLCQVSRYNLGYHIKTWSTEYNKVKQESITPKNNEIICSEFSILFTNIINKLSKEVEARCIITGKEQHLSVGIYVKNKNIRIDFDSTKLIDNFDDLCRVKLGLPLIGVIPICDRDEEFKEAFTKVYKKLHSERKIETEDLIEVYEMLPEKQEIKIDFYENITEFIERMKNKNIVGSELLSTFKLLTARGYFGNIVYSIVSEDKKITLSQRQALETAREILDGLEENIIIRYEEDYYLLRLNDCIVSPVSKDELNYLFEEDKMGYFNPKHPIKGIGVTPCKKI